ncbi:hypothetical protein SCAR479_03313 [Seiridium cardinale]|uniref:Uncharacterized protein n=1 Tax=Seiridium cardinale TaxID=138064 RepID=A0ABR2Y0Z2_9PEZI
MAVLSGNPYAILRDLESNTESNTGPESISSNPSNSPTTSTATIPSPREPVHLFHNGCEEVLDDLIQETEHELSREAGGILSGTDICLKSMRVTTKANIPETKLGSSERNHTSPVSIGNGPTHITDIESPDTPKAELVRAALKELIHIEKDFMANYSSLLADNLRDVHLASVNPSDSVSSHLEEDCEFGPSSGKSTCSIQTLCDLRNSIVQDIYANLTALITDELPSTDHM